MSKQISISRRHASARCNLRDVQVLSIIIIGSRRMQKIAHLSFLGGDVFVQRSFGF
jgi:hypothetical protein